MRRLCSPFIVLGLVFLGSRISCGQVNAAASNETAPRFMTDQHKPVPHALSPVFTAASVVQDSSKLSNSMAGRLNLTNQQEERTPISEFVLSTLRYVYELPIHKKLVNAGIRLVEPHLDAIVNTDGHIRTDILHEPHDFSSLAACNAEINVEELKALIGMIPNDPEELLNVLLRRKSVKNVMMALGKLRGETDMGDNAALLHRTLVKRFGAHRRVMNSVWMDLGVDPKIIFKDLNLDRCNVHDAPVVPLLHCLKYTWDYRSKHRGTYPDEEIAKLLFQNKAAGEVDDYINDVAKGLWYTFLRRDLRSLAKKHDFTFGTNSADFKTRSVLPNPVPANIESIVRFHITSDRKKDASILERLLEMKRTQQVVDDYHGNVIEALLTSNAPVKVARVLVDLYYSADAKVAVKAEAVKAMATILLRLLVVRLQKKLWAMPSAWMEYAVTPEDLFTILGLDKDKLTDVPLELVAQWFRYFELYGSAHSSVYSFEKATELLFKNKDAEDVYAFWKRVAYNSGYSTLAEKLRGLLCRTG